MFISYHFGGVNLSLWFYQQAPNRIGTTICNDLTIPKPPDVPKFLIFGGIGGAAISLIMVLRQRFIWWPFHPIGFVMGFSQDWGPMWRLWFSFFIGWLIKSGIISYLGGSIYKKAKPLFLGLILGEVFVECVVVILQIIFTQEGIYNVFP